MSATSARWSENRAWSSQAEFALPSIPWPSGSFAGIIRTDGVRVRVAIPAWSNDVDNGVIEIPYVDLPALIGALQSIPSPPEWL